MTSIRDRYARAVAEVNRLDEEIQAARAARQYSRVKVLTEQCRIAYGEKRLLSALRKADGAPARCQPEESLGGAYAWSKR